MEIEGLKSSIGVVGVLIEIGGIAIIVLGALYSGYVFFLKVLSRSTEAYDEFRRQLGRSILLGLEFMVAGDIIGTVSVEPTMQNVLTLGLIVLIRTFLSFSLEVELERRLPWDDGKRQEQISNAKEK